MPTRFEVVGGSNIKGVKGFNDVGDPDLLRKTSHGEVAPCVAPALHVPHAFSGHMIARGRCGASPVRYRRDIATRQT